MQMNLEYDGQAQAAPQSFRDAIQAAANVLDATFADNVMINISVGYGEIDGTPESSGSASAGPSTGVYDSYVQVRSWLASNASADVQSGVAALPAGSSIQGQSQVAVWRAQQKLMGQISATDTGLDGEAGFATDISTNLLEGVALHELTHAMGRITYGPQPDILDLFRFNRQGTRLFTDTLPASASYFSLNGGVTDLADYGRNSDDSDFLNSSGRTPNDPFNEFYNASTIQALSSVDLLEIKSLGFHERPTTSSDSALFGSITNNPNSAGGEIYQLYDAVLGSTPDQLSFENQTADLQNGRSLLDIVHGLLASQVFTDTFGSYGQLTPLSFLQDLYRTALHRSPDPQGQQHYEDLLANGTSREEVALDIALSPEHEQNMQAAFNNAGVFVPSLTDTNIARLYYGLLDRAPDGGGLLGWEHASANGLSLDTIAQDFLNSSEYQTLHGPQTDQQFVDALYQAALGRAPDAPGEQQYETMLANGLPRGDVALFITGSPEAQVHFEPQIEYGFKLA
jgi:hypothetical protein